MKKCVLGCLSSWLIGCIQNLNIWNLLDTLSLNIIINVKLCMTVVLVLLFIHTTPNDIDHLYEGHSGKL